METLRLVGLSEDGTRLVVESPAGHMFELPLDERLHAALRGDRSRFGQLQIAIDGEMRPREIQARIRAGQSAEEVAEMSGLPLERVRRYEGPILLERTHMAQTAQTVGVRRVTDAVTTPLGVLVAARLEEHGVAPDSVDWDSWRREDGRWSVRLTYDAAGSPRTATWLFDPQRRSIEPSDDDARWLTDEERAAPEPARPAPTRLAAVPAPEPEPEVGRHETVPVARLAPAPAPHQAAEGDEPDASPLEATDERSGSAAAEEPAGPAPAAAPPAARPAARRRAAVPPAPGAAAPRRERREGRRASVPSWDEILFGGPKRDDD